MELTGFANELGVEYKRKIKGGSKIPGLNNWKDKGVIYQDGKELERKIFMGERPRGN